MIKLNNNAQKLNGVKFKEESFPIEYQFFLWQQYRQERYIFLTGGRH